jgi:hypothetical protein
MSSLPIEVRVAAILGLAALAGCPGGSRARPPATPQVTAVPAPTVKVGDCGVPERDGVMSAAPRLVHADRDLDGDGRAEPVVADRAMCTAEGNCYWNVFLLPADGGCARFAGALAGAYLEPRAPGPGGVPAAVRAYWSLGAPRLLVQEYEFRRGGYTIIDTLVCRREDDDRLRCTEDLR